MTLGPSRSVCVHEGVRSRVSVRPTPDWVQTCPDCGERVKHNGRGGFITVREVNDWLRRQREAADAFRDQWTRENPL